MSNNTEINYGIEDSGVKFDSLLWRAVFNSSKISKTKLENLSIEEIIKQCKTKTLSLHAAAIILLALSKINKKQTKQVLEECTRFLQAMDGKIKPSTSSAQKNQKEKRKLTGSKNVNASIMDEKTFKQTFLDASCENNFNDDFDINSNNNFIMEPEMVRNGTEADTSGRQSAIFSSSTKENDNTKKRLIQDKKIEIQMEDVRKKMNIVMKRDKEMQVLKESKVILENYANQLFLDDQILSAIKVELEEYNAEVVRNSTVASAFLNDDFNNNGPIDFDFNEPDNNCEPVINLEEIPVDFDFTANANDLNRESQARSFFSLLNSLSKNTHTVSQNEPYGKILVTKTEEELFETSDIQ
ncbi:hypothetical protein EHP00_1633 [Ecytonucleospora hepatopenaei]|uniref:Rad21/Rec8-like protein N-terminal domain-containing protein n=1 Tax=Ecytonucleospora hepatopenaei TaxID=646526 RepID=A0A1W0E3I7_9MICR|nr:hypothetical protein EHP00_1633 [Ecytonucleospora hepatopenaei]